MEEIKAAVPRFKGRQPLVECSDMCLVLSCQL